MDEDASRQRGENKGVEKGEVELLGRSKREARIDEGESKGREVNKQSGDDELKHLFYCGILRKPLDLTLTL